MNSDDNRGNVTSVGCPLLKSQIAELTRGETRFCRVDEKQRKDNA